MARGEKMMGPPCKRGHNGLRYAASGGCVECAAEQHAMKRDGTFIGPPKPPIDQLRQQQAAHKARLAKPRGRQPMPVPEGLTAQEFRNLRRRQQRAADPTYRARATEYNRRHETRNQDAVRERKNAWYRANPLTANSQRQRRRGAELQADGFHTARDLRFILAIQRGRCAYCNARKDLHVDHIIPLSRDGSNWPWNLQWLCGRHNTSKGSRTDAEYRAVIGLPVVTPASTAVYLLLFAAV